ncbi:MAG: DUF2442 domain-containing protein [Acidobacteriaceae bacterium]
MALGKDITTDAEIDAAIERGKAFDKHPRVRSARYEPSIDAFSLVLSTGQRFFIPRETLEGLENATEAELSEIEIYSGLSLAWPQLDVDHYFPYILKDRGNPENWFHTDDPNHLAEEVSTKQSVTKSTEAVAA